MIKRILFKLIKPFAKVFLFLKYKNIWNIKEELKKQSTPNKMLLTVYEDYFYRYGSWIGYKSEISGIPCFPHSPIGIFISNESKLGKNVVIFQQVTIGSNTLSDSQHQGSPIIGNNVYIGCGAKIIGAVTIGDNCRIGANAVVYKDMPPHSVAVQSPTRIVQKSNLDNRYFSIGNKEKWVYYDDGRWIEDKNE